MITTKTYNNFSSYTWEQRSNKEFMFNEMKAFVEAGGSLSHDVIYKESKLISFSDYIKENFSVDFMDKLVDNNLVDNPFSFILKKDEKLITERVGNGLIWMRNNYDHFKKQIVNSVVNISKLTNGVELNNYSQINYDGIYVDNKSMHPLFHIANTLENHEEIWEAILDNNKDIHLYLKNFLLENENSEVILKRIFNNNNNSLINIFYKHDLIDNYIDKNPHVVYDMVSNSIHSNDLEIFNKLSTQYDILKIEKEHSSYDSFLSKASTPEMAEMILKAGCFSIGVWEGKQEKNQQEKFHYSLSKKMNRETLSFIINYIDKDLVKNNHTYFFNNFIKNVENLDTIKLLIEKHSFPIEKYDMLKIGQKVSSDISSVDTIKWFLENGADPRICNDFIDTIVYQREEGKKCLVQYRKEGLIDPFSSDMVYAIASSKDLKKVFINYYEKITSEQLARPNKEGVPAWFGVKSQEFFTIIKHKVEDYNQLSIKGDAWINYLLEPKKAVKDRDSVILKWLEKAKESVVRKGGNKLSGSISTDRDGNFLHDLFFLAKHQKEDIKKELVNFIFNNVDADFVKLLNEKKSNGEYPLSNFFFYSDKSENQSNNWNNISTLDYLIESLGKDFPFEQEINGSLVIDLLSQKYGDEKYKVQYLNYKLNNVLQPKGEKSKSVKI